jgi:hypothetical protein
MFNNNTDMREATINALQGLAVAEIADGNEKKGVFLVELIDLYTSGIINVSFSNTGEPIMSLTDRGTDMMAAQSSVDTHPLEIN